MATKLRTALAASIAAGLFGGCSAEGDQTNSSSASSPSVDVAPSAKGSAAEASVKAVLRHLAAQGSSAEGASPPRTADVRLPARASGSFRVVDEASGVGVEVRLEGARDVAGEDASGLVAYPGGYENADVLHRKAADGTEDYLYFGEKLPQKPWVRYEVTLGEGVAGLRLVGKLLELLDAGGAPRLHMAPPYAIDAKGQTIELDVELEGCDYSTDARLPYGRPVVAPGARTCGLRVGWEGKDVAAPLLVDPGWASTGTMAIKRGLHTATLLKSGFVMVTGGDKGGSFSHNYVEIYNPGPGMGAGTWAAANNMITPRYGHTATLLADDTVLVVGGKNTSIGAVTNAAEIYNPNTGNWTATAPLQEGRMLHTATALPDHRVLVMGGDRFPAGEPSVSAEVYDPATKAWSPAGTMPSPRELHTATLLEDGSVLVVGGFNMPFLGGQFPPLAQKTAWIWSANTFSQSFDTNKAHGAHIAERLASGRVLVAGGPTTNSAEIFDPENKTWKQAGSMAVARSNFASALLPGGRVLVTGNAGDNLSTSQSAEVYDPLSSTWTSTGLMMSKHAFHTATRLANDRVLVAGGTFSQTSIAEAEIYTPLGAGCATDQDCTDSFCVDGVCCNSLCEGQCEACDGAKSIGLCTPVLGAQPKNREPCSGDSAKCSSCDGLNGTTCTYPTGTSCDKKCEGDVLVANSCDGAGSCSLSESVSCAPYKCDADALVPACFTQCTDDKTCSGNAVCTVNANVCVTVPTVCNDDRFLKLPDGTPKDCAPFACRNGACLESCTSVDDCAGDPADQVICDELTASCKNWKQFDPTPTNGNASCGCSVPGEGAPSRAPWLVALAAAAMIAARRRLH